ncbi:uncharacterized protein B0I36DRAFT_308950 [Microdochium trichocladiopsis]|uniref:Uncharacterized protein n=1 Tax=Microdochium trichocladiopsis TaxID=1682393 RepID=A0A9P9BVI5_9PEZI|nr:uncharacterized protein B0I36DRAFT_308950 [Microdochium trichocladiopsis]KAH7039600.1 hypothetical protein B0I36DRAFT_308950 [Microdochium trichocladiopsis]
MGCQTAEHRQRKPPMPTTHTGTSPHPVWEPLGPSDVVPGSALLTGRRSRAVRPRHRQVQVAISPPHPPGYQDKGLLFSCPAQVGFCASKSPGS